MYRLTMAAIALEEAIARTQAGDVAAFGNVYDGFVEKIYRFVYYKTHHKETAEDITSDVFMKALHGIRSFDPEKGSVAGWLYRIARNSVVDHYRRRKPDLINVDDAWDLAGDSDVARDTEAKLLAERLRAHLTSLTSDQRDVVMMRVWEDMSYREIADALGKSEASCKMAFCRAVKHLGGRLAPALILGIFLRHL